MNGFEKLELRCVLCGGPLPPATDFSPEVDNAAAAVFIDPPATAPAEFVDDNTVILEADIGQGLRRHVVYADASDGVFRNIGSQDPRIVGTPDDPIPRSAGQRRLELSVIGNQAAVNNVASGRFAIGTGGGVYAKPTIRFTGSDWRPDPFSGVAPTLQASNYLERTQGHNGWRGGPSGAQELWELHSPERKERALRSFFTGDEWNDIQERSARVLANRVVYA